MRTREFAGLLPVRMKPHRKGVLLAQRTRRWPGSRMHAGQPESISACTQHVSAAVRIRRGRRKENLPTRREITTPANPTLNSATSPAQEASPNRPTSRRELEAHKATRGLDYSRRLERKLGLVQEEARSGPIGLDLPWHASHM